MTKFGHDNSLPAGSWMVMVLMFGGKADVALYNFMIDDGNSNACR